MAAKVAKWAALPTVLAWTSTHALDAAEGEQKSRRVKAHQLPIYNAPPLESRYIDEKPGRLQTRISSIRKSTSYYLKNCKDAYLFVKSGVTTSLQFGKDVYVYLKNPPPEFLPKVGVITVSGLTGIVLARKGSRFKKIAYPVCLGSLGISLCYPAQSVIVAKVTGSKVYAASHKMYTTVGSLWTKKPSAEVAQEKDTQEASRVSHSLPKTQEAPVESEDKVETSEEPTQRSEVHKDYETSMGEMKAPNVRTDVLKAPKYKADTSLMDYGQASPEDADLYSKRS
ncbi:MICOS complex subunit MIC27 isoform X2 [Pseudonaja textilis]|uniref:MICOS complex subunit MIC27 isoform X2 n=1 Tax=Pseudonaja textilis TaxID=8673 RepID=UPI000EA8923A|nr:MICOS complex subunit MIC27 isoform X2 [Pseudonaja textilis]